MTLLKRSHEPSVLSAATPEARRREVQRRILHDDDFRARLKQVHGYSVHVVRGKIMSESYDMSKDTTLSD